MIYKFDHIRDNLITELKAKYLDAMISIRYLQGECVKPNEMSKAQAEEQLGLWQKQAISIERKLERYNGFDVSKLKKFDYGE